ncbi:DUF3883 domain-containing protein [Longispora sp. NPDC051575]|uniref:protein NO VEIN domain-containing protein n=1 Tax=Longispora sp. NPDC051575 TaxID=3154943 RepID=UPI003418F5A5
MKELVLSVWSSSTTNGRRNLQHGIDTQTWGFNHDDPDYAQDIRWMLFGFGHSGGSPRMKSGPWQTGRLSIGLCQVTVPRYVGKAPHWPDELHSGEIIYPYRFGITPVASLDDVSASQDDVLGSLAENLRLAATGNRGILAVGDLELLLDKMNVPYDGDYQPDLSQTLGILPPSPAPRNRRGAGRSNDPELRSTIEKHAVQLAITHMRSQGWHNVVELGKPYDLVCTNSSGQEKHVEVKGTSGAGADVEYTPNEVRHFRNCPDGADLIVVNDIRVDRSARPYTASGGKLRHFPSYRAPAEDLQATGWLGRVPSSWK